MKKPIRIVSVTQLDATTVLVLDTEGALWHGRFTEAGAVTWTPVPLPEKEMPPSVPMPPVNSWRRD